MILPSRLLLAVSASWLAIAAGSAFAWWSPTLWLHAGALIMAVTVVDAYLLLSTPIPRGRRETAAAFSAGRLHDVRLVLSNDARKGIHVRVHDLHPAEFEC
jgi:uncharacterized protein (DUF58 family)